MCFVPKSINILREYVKIILVYPFLDLIIHPSKICYFLALKQEKTKDLGCPEDMLVKLYESLSPIPNVAVNNKEL